MKKLIFAIAAIAVMGISTSAAEVTGSILATDIGTLIDGAPCKTYNVDGRTFVIAEDLRGYGFDVVYDDSLRRLTITQNPYSERTILSADEVNFEKSWIAPGQHKGDMYATDITVCLGDTLIEGYAIDGQMVIPVRSLEKYAYIEYSDKYRVITVSGLQHYLTERYNAGNPNVTYSTTTDNSFDSSSRNRPASNKCNVVTATDTEKGSIHAEYGKYFDIWTSSGYYFWGSRYYDAEKYTIRNSEDELLYEVSIKKRIYYHDEEKDFETDYGYIINGMRAALLSDEYHNQLYRCTFKAITERENYDYWPSEAELENVSFKGFSTYGYTIITDNGLLCSFASGKLNLIRYNILDQPNSSYYLAADNKLYREQSDDFGNKINSYFDKCVDENVAKFNYGYYLKTDGSVPTLGLTNVRDVIPLGTYPYIYTSVLKNNGELYVGLSDDFKNDTASKVTSNVREIYINKAYFGIYYITTDNQLYRYTFSDWKSKKIADNIRKPVGNNLFITTNGELTNLENIIATNVKDATDRYILTNDNQILEYKDGTTSVIYPQ